MIRNIAAICIFSLLAFLAFHLESATNVKSADTSGFSADNAFEYLKEIAKEPHPIGSIENKKVKDYLVNTLTNMGLEVEIQKGYTRSSWKPSYMKMAYVENVIATLKGTDPNAKKVVLSCHYDSVMEGPGAADDGYAVACAIETVKLLKKENRKSDIELLITDGEEYGLLGAQYYAKNTDLSQIGIMLNYEARGNEGPGIAFEWSDNNAWLVEEMSKAYRRPIANSLSYEVYKRMGNGSDFTIFKRKDIPGINHAFIDGFSYYHHPQDNIETVSRESIQHTGENMYLAAKHFSNYEFKEEKKNNATFFNFYGLFIHYGADLDLILFSLAMLLAVILMTTYKRLHRTTTKDTLLSLLSLIGVLILCSGLSFGLSCMLKMVYPQYSTFYASHYYNHEWYLLAGIGLTIIISALLGRKLITKFNPYNIGVSTLLILNVLGLVLYIEASSATYLMLYPLAIIATGLLVQSRFEDPSDNTKKYITGLISLGTLIGFWGTFSHSIYLAFSLSILAAAILPTVLFCMASYALLPELWQKYNVPVSFGVLLFIITMSAAHHQSKATVDRPLKTNLFYTYNSENEQTSVATFDDHIHEGHVDLIDENNATNLAIQMPYYTLANPSSMDITPYRPDLSYDMNTVDPMKKSVQLLNPKRASMIHVYIPDITNLDRLLIDDQLNKDFKEGANGSFYSPMYGIGLDSMKLSVLKRDTSITSKLYVNIQYRELPLPDQLPPHTILNDGKIIISEMIEI